VTESDRRPGPYPYYGANGQQGTIDDFIFDEPLILLAEDGGHFEDPTRGIAYRISGKSWVNNHAHVLRPTKEMDLRFLCRVLENYDVTPWVTGTTRGKLTQAGAAQIVVPVPTLPEQQRIAEILDKGDALRAKRRAALVQIDMLAQSIFLGMFGDPATNSKGWATSTIDEVSEKVTDGEHLTPKREPFGIKLLSARNVRDGRIDLTEVDYIGLEEYTRIAKRCDPTRGDVLISCSGTIGRVASVETDEPLALVRSAAMLRPNQSRVRTKFLELYLRTPTLKRLMLRRANASSQANLFQAQIRALPAFVPPLSLQDLLVSRVAAVESLRSKTVSSSDQLEHLFTSLQHRAFVGVL